MSILTTMLIAMLAQGAGSRQLPLASAEGTVITMGSAEPLAGARVELQPEKGAVQPDLRPVIREYVATTSQDGKFSLDGVAPGLYRLIATRAGGYVPAEYGQRTPTSQGIPFELAAGQKMTGIQLAMAATGSITGRIYDQDGEPLGKAQVQALRSIYKEGRRILTGVQTVETNDRGEYRLFWLTPGRYYVSARPDIPALPINPMSSDASSIATVRVTEPARFGSYEHASVPVIRKRRLKDGEMIEETSIPVYYPGVVETQAALPVAVNAGTAAAGVDISVVAGVVMARHIRGRVINAENGQPLSGAGITAIPQTSDPSLRIPHGQSDSNGFFDVPGATTGRYFVLATSNRVSGMAAVEVGNADAQNIAIVTRPGFTVSGRFSIEGRSRTGEGRSRTGEGRSRTGIELRISDLRVAQFVPDPNILGMPSGGPSFNPPPLADGSFTLDGVKPGDFRVTLRAVPPDAYVKSIRLGNADVLDGGLHLSAPPENPLEIVIGADAGRINGSVVNARQELLANRIVVLVPDVRLRHRSDLYKTVATDNSGRFRSQGITPGSYQLFAWEDVETGAWQNPDFIRIHEGRGRPVQVNEGSDENVQLTVIP